MEPSGKEKMEDMEWGEWPQGRGLRLEKFAFGVLNEASPL